MATRRRDIDTVARHFQQRLASLYASMAMRDVLVKGLCQNLNKYMFSHLVKEDFNTIQNGVETPEHFEQLLADVAVGLNRELNNFMDFIYTVQLLFSPGMNINIMDNAQPRQRPKEEITLHTLRDKLYDCMYKITPLIDKVVEKFKDVAIIKPEDKKRPDPPANVIDEITIESDSDHDNQEDNVAPEDDTDSSKPAENQKSSPEPGTSGQNQTEVKDQGQEETPMSDEQLLEEIYHDPEVMSDTTALGNTTSESTATQETSEAGGANTSQQTPQGTTEGERGPDYVGHSDTPTQHVCEKCGAYFLSNLALTQHLDRDHKYQYTHMCEHCGWLFKSKAGCEAHIAAKHTSGRDHICEECGREFASELLLKRHKGATHRERAQICEFCGKGFRRTYQLRIHMNIHTGERPYVCDVCGKGYADPTTCRKHKLTHKKVQEDFAT